MSDLVKYQQYLSLSPVLTHMMSFEHAAQGTEMCCNYLGAPGATGAAEGPSRGAGTGELWLSTVGLEQCPEAEPGLQLQPSCGHRVAVGTASPALLPVLCKVCRELHSTMEPLLIPICMWKNIPVGLSLKKNVYRTN